MQESSEYIPLFPRYFLPEQTGCSCSSSHPFDIVQPSSVCRDGLRRISESYDVIHPPSTFRLLRLVLARRCERMDQCFALNLDSNLSTKHSVAHVHYVYGLAACKTCLNSLSTDIYKSSRWYAEQYPYWRMFWEPLTETVTNEPIGPLICTQLIRRIESTEKATDTRTSDRIARLKQCVEDTTTAQPADTKDEFMQSLCEAMAEFPRFSRNKREIEWRREREARETKAANRRARATVVLEKMDKILGEYELKAPLLEHTWNYCSGTCRFKYSISRCKLGALVDAPSGATKKKITEVIADVRQVFDMLHSRGFTPGVSLKFQQAFQLPRGAPRSHKALFKYLDEGSSVDFFLGRDGAGSDGFVELVNQGKLWEACCTILHSWEFSNAFVGAGKRQTPRRYQSRVRGLLDIVWHSVPATGISREPTRKAEDLNAYEGRFDGCLKEYKILLAHFRQYTRRPTTAAFLSTRHDTDEEYESLTGEDVVKLLLDGEDTTKLWNREFDALLSRHRLILRSPWEWEQNYGW
jgi:hypothetical protein